ncbi:MAG: Ubiquinone/menaquinone biosynthesis C-methylase UbiE/MenG [Thermodesulfobacteria bacterium]|nr:Ubiquinone/menaquinone biosynthesis C-methylase UbiE/MenG [Thermodesulfobacteriota bacterium]
MASFQAKMFNKKASDPKNKPDKIIEAIALKPGQSIADIGSGGGYFSLRFAKIVGEEGRVYAVDTKPELLEYVKNSAREEGLDNVIPTLVSEDKLDLPEKSLDLIFMRNVTHHIPNRVEYFKSLKRFLKPDGRIAIIEYKKGKIFTFRGLFGHYIPKETIVQEMEEAGYSLEKEFNFFTRTTFYNLCSEKMKDKSIICNVPK